MYIIIAWQKFAPMKASWSVGSLEGPMFIKRANLKNKFCIYANFKNPKMYSA
jgi:hypothetical protein